MKALAKNLARGEDALGIIRGLEAEAWAEGDGAPGRRMTYEELVVWGLMISYMKIPWSVRAELLQRFIPVLDNWGVCDTFCSNAKWVYADGCGLAAGDRACQDAGRDSCICERVAAAV